MPLPINQVAWREFLPGSCRVLHKLGHACVILALVAALGGHWALLQTVAWTNMLATNLRTESLEVAVSKTFDGQHPCRLCEVVAAGKKSERRAEFPKSLKKLEFVSARLVLIFPPPEGFRWLPEPKVAFANANLPPPVPPPRRFLA